MGYPATDCRWRNGSAQLDRLSFSVCRDRAWFTPIGYAHQPRDWSNLSEGSNAEFGIRVMTDLRAVLSIPIRVDSAVGLGLLMQCEETGIFSRGEFLSGSSERRANAHSNELPMDYAYHDGFAVELLTDPFEDDGRIPLAPLPLAVVSAPFGQELVEAFIGGFMQAMGWVMLREGGEGLERVDVDASLQTAWTKIWTKLREETPA